jgi:hypothetical protein
MSNTNPTKQSGVFEKGKQVLPLTRHAPWQIISKYKLLVLLTLFVFVCAQWCPTHIVLCFWIIYFRLFVLFVVFLCFYYPTKQSGVFEKGKQVLPLTRHAPWQIISKYKLLIFSEKALCYSIDKKRTQHNKIVTVINQYDHIWLSNIWTMSTWWRLFEKRVVCTRLVFTSSCL